MPIDVTIYACEHCYTRFDDRIECVKHEKQHRQRDVATETDMAQLCPQSALTNGDDDPVQRLNQALFSQSFNAHFENNPLSTQAAAFTAACLLSGSNALDLKPQTAARNETPSPQKTLSSNEDASQLSASAKKRQRKTSKPMRIVSDMTPPNESSNQSMDATPPPPDLASTPTRLSTLAPTMCASPASATFLPHTNIINKRGRSNKTDGSPDDGDNKFDASQSAMCDICGKVFKSRYHVRFHKQCKHGGRRFTCLVCQFTFDRVSNVKRHLLRTHGRHPDELKSLYSYARVARPEPDPVLEALSSQMEHTRKEELPSDESRPTSTDNFPLQTTLAVEDA